jgi:hypothetical protein
MSEENKHPQDDGSTIGNEITFEVPAEVIEKLRMNGKPNDEIRLSGEIRYGKLVIDNVSFAEKGELYPGTSFLAVNAPFVTKELEQAERV